MILDLNCRWLVETNVGESKKWERARTAVWKTWHCMLQCDTWKELKKFRLFLISESKFVLCLQGRYTILRTEFVVCLLCIRVYIRAVTAHTQTGVMSHHWWRHFSVLSGIDPVWVKGLFHFYHHFISKTIRHLFRHSTRSRQTVMFNLRWKVVSIHQLFGAKAVRTISAATESVTILTRPILNERILRVALFETADLSYCPTVNTSTF